MADLPTITWTSGAPDAGQSGTVQTISNLTDRVGEVQASPTANTVLDRLKTLNSSLASVAQDSSLAGFGTVNDPAPDVFTTQPFSSARANRGRQATTISDTTETTIVTAAASTFNDIYFLGIWNAGSTAVNVTVRDDTAGTTVAIIYVPANGVGGFRLSEGAPLGQALVNKPWTAQADGSTTLHITALFIKNTA